MGLLSDGLEMGHVGIECRAGARTGLAQALAIGFARGLAGQHVAHVASAGAGRRKAAFDDEFRAKGGIEVGAALLEGAGYLLEPGNGRVDELVVGPEPVEEQVEEAVQDGPRVDRWITLPDLPVGVDRAATQGGHDQLAIDLSLWRQSIGGRLEARQPVHRLGITTMKGVFGQVVEALVVVGQSQATGRHGRVLELVQQEIVDELAEVLHHLVMVKGELRDGC